MIRACEIFQTQVPPEASHPPTEGKVRVHPLDRCGAQGWEEAADLPRRCRDLSAVRGLQAPCSPTSSAGRRRASHSLHRELPGRTLQVKHLYFSPLLPFPERDCWTGQSCLSDASKSADFASCLCFTICDYLRQTGELPLGAN